MHGIASAMHGIAIAMHGIAIAMYGIARAMHGIARAMHGIATAMHGMASTFMASYGTEVMAGLPVCMVGRPDVTTLPKQCVENPKPAVLPFEVPLKGNTAL